jgi:hypothetical protein
MTVINFISGLSLRACMGAVLLLTALFGFFYSLYPKIDFLALDYPPENHSIQTCQAFVTECRNSRTVFEYNYHEYRYYQIFYAFKPGAELVDKSLDYKARAKEILFLLNDFDKNPGLYVKGYSYIPDKTYAKGRILEVEYLDDRPEISRLKGMTRGLFSFETEFAFIIALFCVSLYLLATYGARSD